MTALTRHWLKGLISVFVNGFASGVVLLIVDPTGFDLVHNWKKLLMTAFVLGLLGLANYLKQSPLPPDDSGPVNPARFATLLVLAVSLAFTPACAVLKSPKVDPPTKVDVALYEALATIQDAEMAARYVPTGGKPVITQADHKLASSYIASAFAGLAAYNDALDVGNAVGAAEKLKQIRKALNDLEPLLRRAIPDATARAKITAGIDLALSILAPLLQDPLPAASLPMFEPVFLPAAS